MIEVFLLILLVLGLLVRYLRPSKASTAPGPIGFPVLGHLPLLGTAPQLKMTEWRKRYGDVYQIRMGSYPTVVLNGIKTVKQALVKQAEDFAGRPDFFSFEFIANGKSMGFSDYGAKWKMHRRIAQNALTQCANKKYNPIEEAITTEANFLVHNLLKADGKPVDPHTEIYLSVGNIICALCFGKRYRRDDPDFCQLVKNNDDFMAFIGAGKVFNPFSNDEILDSSKLEELADDNFKFNENGRKSSKRVENAVGKGENARYEQFLLFPRCFQKIYFFQTR